MPNRLKKLHLRDMDKALKPFAKLIPDDVIPRKGWVREIRRAIGMTTLQLAERMEVTPSTVSALEKSEAGGAVTLKSLKRAADALDCELLHVLIPRRPLSAMVESRARLVARQRVDRVAHTMRLEEQSLTARELEAQYRDLVRELSEHPTKELWDRASAGG